MQKLRSLLCEDVDSSPLMSLRAFPDGLGTTVTTFPRAHPLPSSLRPAQPASMPAPFLQRPSDTPSMGARVQLEAPVVFHRLSLEWDRQGLTSLTTRSGFPRTASPDAVLQALHFRHGGVDTRLGTAAPIFLAFRNLIGLRLSVSIRCYGWYAGSSPTGGFGLASLPATASSSSQAGRSVAPAVSPGLLHVG